MGRRPCERRHGPGEVAAAAKEDPGHLQPRQLQRARVPTDPRLRTSHLWTEIISSLSRGCPICGACSAVPGDRRRRNPVFQVRTAGPGAPCHAAPRQGPPPPLFKARSPGPAHRGHLIAAGSHPRRAVGIRSGGLWSHASDVCGLESGARRRDGLVNISGTPGCSPWMPGESPRRRPPSEGQRQAWRRDSLPQHRRVPNTGLAWGSRPAAPVSTAVTLAWG